MDRITLGRMQNPVRGFLHGAAAVLSVVALVVLAIKTNDSPLKMWSMIVFGLSLVALYTTSSLYHSIAWQEKWRARLQRLDHSMILVLVAGSWTPMAINLLEGTWRIVTLSVVWGSALVGIIQKWFFSSVRIWFTITLAVSMGWFALIPLSAMTRQIGMTAIGLLVLSGAMYTVGMVMFASQRPKMFPRIFSYHELFHVLVVAGSVTHFVLVFRYIVPL
jgi:hemolysin III